MGFFTAFIRPDVNAGVQEYKQREGAVLLDVRTEEEYAEGRIPESVNLPLQRIGSAEAVVSEKTTPIYVYCHSGARSRQAKAALVRMGYGDVTDLGGIAAYRGKVVR